MAFFIGNVKIDGQVVLAPMAGVTNLEYRKMAQKFGACLTTSEMISDKGIYYNDKKTLELLNCQGLKHPYAIQIFGGDIETLLYAAKFIDKNTNCDIIDINMGCPVPKIIRSNAGSKYLQDPERIYNTVKTIVKNVKKPVTVKIRIGWDHNSINVLEVAQLIKKAGASAITIHGRTKTDLYSGTVRYDLIKKVKEELKDFPIIANGDINSPLKAKEVLDYTKCDAVMVGRASYGNFYVFEQINTYLTKNILLEEQTLDEKKKNLIEYSKNLISLKTETVAIRELRSQAGWFIKKVHNSAKYRNLLTQINSFSELLNILEKIK